MHRSATSLVAGWLQRCGLNIGDNLLDKDFSNKAGHFEDLDFLNLHKDILRSNGLDISGLNIKSTDFVLQEYHQARLRYLIEMKNKLHVQWGWKDPRTCLFIKYYLEQVPDLKILIVYRPAIEIIQSLINRDWNRWKRQITGQALAGLHPKLVLSHYFRRKLMNARLPQYLKACEIYFGNILQILNEGSKMNVKLVTLPYLLKNNEYVLTDIKDNWGLDLSYSPLENIYSPEFLRNKSMNIVIPEGLKKLDDQLSELTLHK
jgi:hypothetical protein